MSYDDTKPSTTSYLSLTIGSVLSYVTSHLILSKFDSYVATSNAALGFEAIRGNDLPWLYDSSTNRMIINGFQVLDKIDINTVKVLIQERVLPSHPRLRKHVSVNPHTGSFVWANDTREFDIDNHVYIASEFKDRRTPVSEEELEQYIGLLSNRLMKYKHSVFEYILIENFKDEKHSALVIRFHHVVGDGISLVGLLSGCTDDDYSSTNNTTTTTCHTSVATKVAKSGPSPLGFLLKLPLMPYYWAHQVLCTADNNCLHKPRETHSLSGNRSVAWTSPLIPLDDVKVIKNALNCSLNDILMTCVAGAFSRYFNESDNQEDVISEIHAAVPVSMRSGYEIKNLKLCNKISVVNMPLPTSFETSRLDRLKQTIDNMNSIKNSIEPLAQYVGFLASEYFPKLLQRYVLTTGATKATTILTNVPGPAKALVYYGRTVHEMAFFVPAMANIGVGISVFSYNGSVRMGATVDKSLCPDASVLCQDFSKELEAFKTIAADIMLQREIDEPEAEECENTDNGSGFFERGQNAADDTHSRT